MVMRVAKFVIGETRSILHDEAARVDEPGAPEGLGFGYAFRHHRRDHEVGDAGRGLTRAKEQYPLVSKFSVVHAQRREKPRERYRGRSLNVVVEDIYLVPIFVKQPERRVIGEVLELNQHAGECLTCSRDELVDEFVVRRAAQALLPQANIIAIVEKIL